MAVELANVLRDEKSDGITCVWTEFGTSHDAMELTYGEYAFKHAVTETFSDISHLPQSACPYFI